MSDRFNEQARRLLKTRPAFVESRTDESHWLACIMRDVAHETREQCAKTIEEESDFAGEKTAAFLAERLRGIML